MAFMLKTTALLIVALATRGDGATLTVKVYSAVATSCASVNDVNGTTISTQDTININTASWASPFQPSCSEILDHLGIGATTEATTVVTKCFSRASTQSIPPSSTTLSNPITDFAQQFDLFRQLMSPSDTYASKFGSFQITACSEPTATFYLERTPDQLSLTEAADCYYVQGASNLTTTCMLSQLQYLQMNLSYNIEMDATLQRVNHKLTGSLGTYLSTGSNDLPDDCEISSKTWTLNTTATGVVLSTSSLGVPYTLYTLNAQEAMPKLIFGDNSLSSPVDSATVIDVIAKSVAVSLGRTSDGNGSTVTVEVVRPLGAKCSLSYRVARRISGVNYGPFLELSEYNVTTASISKTGVKPEGALLALQIPLRGCLEKCMSSMEVTTPGGGYNVFYGTTAVVNNAWVKSTSKNTECLCGVVNQNYIDINQRSPITETAGVLTATVNSIATGDRAFASTGIVVEYDVTSGAAYGASSSDPADVVGPLAGAIVGGIIAFVIFAVAFWFLSHKQGDAMKEGSDTVMEKTTSPLAGVQVGLLVLATALAFASVCSPEMYTVIVEIPASGARPSYATTYSLGIFLHITSTTSIGSGFVGTGQPYFATTSNSQLEYTCMQFLEDDSYALGGSSDLTFTYVQACQAVRATSVVTVCAGVLAVVCAFYQRQKAVLPLVIVSVLCGVVAFGVFNDQIVNQWVSKQVDNNPWTMVYGTAFNAMVASFFFFLLEVAAWIIDSFKSTPVL